MKHHTGYTFLIGWGILSIVLLVGYGILFSRVGRANESVAVFEESLAFEVERNTRLKSIETLVEDTATEREELSRHFLNEKDVVTFLESVESLGLTTGLTVDIEHADVSREAEKDPLLTLRIHTAGSWSATVRFIALIENLAFINTISSIELSAAETASGSLWETFFTLDVYLEA